MTLRLRMQTCAALALTLALAPASPAVVLDIGGLKGSFDTTVSVGGLFRAKTADPALYGLSNGGTQRSVNVDDGNLNYDRGIVSSLVKANHDLHVEFGTGGVFVRGFYFHDFTNENGRRNKIPLTDDARSIVGRGGELLDAYLYLKPTIGGMPAVIRIGQQVLSWGESTFIPNGINAINPIDVAKLRAPGSELKEALLPLRMISGSLSVTDDLTLEAFYMLDWDRTRVDPSGTYFSSSDFVSRGGKKVYLGFGAIRDTSTLGAINRGPDGEPDDTGQWGINARYFTDVLGGTEFGLYFMNYHSRIPALSARTPTGPVSSALVQATASSLANANIAPAMIAAGIPSATVSAVLPSLVGAALLGVPAAGLPPTLAPFAAFYPATQSVAAGATQIGFLTAAGTAQYLVEYPDDIRLVGASFNSSIRGVAIQGELSYRSNQPLQIDDVELLFAALSSLSPTFGANNQMGNFFGQFGTRLEGFRRHKVYTGQMTATYVGAGVLGANQTTLLGEVGFVNVTDLPSKTTLRYDGPATFTGGNPTAMANTGNAAAGSEPLSAFADDFSWGYTIVGRLDYNNAFAGVNFSPLFVFAHDVSGNTPLPLGNFREERKTLTVGADFNYQNSWAFELRYVNFFGAGKYNLLGDRDYFSATVKYSF